MVLLNVTKSIRLVFPMKKKMRPNFHYTILWDGEDDNKDNNNKAVIVDTHTPTVKLTHSTSNAPTQPYRSTKKKFQKRLQVFHEQNYKQHKSISWRNRRKYFSILM